MAGFNLNGLIPGAPIPPMIAAAVRNMPAFAAAFPGPPGAGGLPQVVHAGGPPPAAFPPPPVQAPPQMPFIPARGARGNVQAAANFANAA